LKIGLIIMAMVALMTILPAGRLAVYPRASKFHFVITPFAARSDEDRTYTTHGAQDDRLQYR
jgi:hypothetical protein